MTLKPKCACGIKAYATQAAADRALAKVRNLGLRDEMPKRVAQCFYGQWHLEGKKQVDTGPDRTLRDLVWVRDEGRCARCGAGLLNRQHAVHHRRNRGSGGSSDPAINSPANLLMVCDGPGSCHEWIGDSPAEACDAGYMVSLNSDEDPADVWVIHKVFNSSVQLLHDGSLRFPPEWGGAA
jgi:5-methylcytosine-specific restriction protein A